MTCRTRVEILTCCACLPGRACGITCLTCPHGSTEMLPAYLNLIINVCMLRSLVSLCRTEIHHRQNRPGCCRPHVHGGRIDSLFVRQPDPRPGDVSNWPQRPGPLLAPPAPMIGVNRTIPGIDLHIQSRPAGHPVAVVFAGAHILWALFEELSESLHHPCWKSFTMHA